MREHIVSAQLSRDEITDSPFRSPRCTSAPFPCRLWLRRTADRGNCNTGRLALAMAIVRNSSRRQRVSVYKHCKVTHQTVISSHPPDTPARFGLLSRVTSRVSTDRSQRRTRQPGKLFSGARARLINAINKTISDNAKISTRSTE